MKMKEMKVGGCQPVCQGDVVTCVGSLKKNKKKNEKERKKWRGKR